MVGSGLGAYLIDNLGVIGGPGDAKVLGSGAREFTMAGRGPQPPRVRGGLRHTAITRKVRMRTESPMSRWAWLTKRGPCGVQNPLSLVKSPLFYRGLFYERDPTRVVAGVPGVRRSEGRLSMFSGRPCPRSQRHNKNPPSRSETGRKCRQRQHRSNLRASGQICWGAVEDGVTSWMTEEGATGIEVDSLPGKRRAGGRKDWGFSDGEERSWLFLGDDGPTGRGASCPAASNRWGEAQPRGGSMPPGAESPRSVRRAEPHPTRINSSD